MYENAHISESGTPSYAVGVWDIVTEKCSYFSYVIFVNEATVNKNIFIK